MPTASGSCSTAPWCGPTPAPPGQKNRRRASAWPLARRLLHQLHGLADALGNPLAFSLTAGQQGDAPHAQTLLDPVTTTAVIAASLSPALEQRHSDQRQIAGLAGHVLDQLVGQGGCSVLLLTGAGAA